MQTLFFSDQMKSCFAFPLLSTVGIGCGVSVGALNTAFITNCGESCPDDPLLWALGCSITFPVIGHLLLKKTRHTVANTMLVAVALAATVLLPALTMYACSLHEKYWRLHGKQVYPDIEYSLMVISEEPLPTLGIAEAERCVINNDLRCGENPQVIPALCQSGFVSLPRKHWSSFKRLPNEDLQGPAPANDNRKYYLNDLCQQQGTSVSQP
ncbi:hypothetical protein ACIPLR_12945 [Herbaspirillum huttiense]|uniref:hypothetical protein n=1 Tax=Herbaspirillum huttiense TaxID=863372 RepID=UPI0005843BBE|nr:hypothetical protein [Herbaspirillum huttiense]MBN9355990.1 hypothetical protein [Herbaspirillum huttiense]